MSTINAVLAQLAEQLICNHQVVGSIPIDGTRSINKYTGNGIFFIFLYSYKRKHKDGRIDLIIPILGIALLALVYVEGIYQFILEFVHSH